MRLAPHLGASGAEGVRSRPSSLGVLSVLQGPLTSEG